MAELLHTSDAAQRSSRGEALCNAFERLMAWYTSELELTGVSTEMPGASRPMIYPRSAGEKLL